MARGGERRIKGTSREPLNTMDQATHSKIVSFLWGIADDVLRDLFKRGKYPDVILPMCVLRRLDAVLEPTKKAVLEQRDLLDSAGITEQSAVLCDAAQQAFYNTSKFTLRDLRARKSEQQLRLDFEDYLGGFSSNVQDILENFKFRNQIPTLSKADALGTLIEKFLDPEINLSPTPVLNGDGSVKHPPMDNHAMGTVFEELVRKFNEENNEEAGEHWTPRDAVRLMANLVFLPVADALESAPPVIAKIHKRGKVDADPLHGQYELTIDGKRSVVEYEPDSELRDTEQVPLLEPGGIEAFFRREVLPHVPDAWIDPDATKIGYEISFTRHFYQPKPLRSLEEIRADILAVQSEAEGLLDELVQGASK
jgi:hypothetical protein